MWSSDGLVVLLGALSSRIGHASGFEIIAHRGSSGEFPESSSVAYKIAEIEGADYLECDVVASKDEVLYCSHEVHISDMTTDVWMMRHRHAFQLSAIKTEDVELVEFEESDHLKTGWFIADYDSKEIDQLRLKQRFSDRIQFFNNQFPFYKLEDLLTLAIHRKIGLFIEPKHTHWHKVTRDIHLIKLIVAAICSKFDCQYSPHTDTFTPPHVHQQTNGKNIPIFIESFTYEDLRYLHKINFTQWHPTCALTQIPKTHTHTTHTTHTPTHTPTQTPTTHDAESTTHSDPTRIAERQNATSTDLGKFLSRQSVKAVTGGSDSATTGDSVAFLASSKLGYGSLYYSADDDGQLTPRKSRLTSRAMSGELLRAVGVRHVCMQKEILLQTPDGGAGLVRQAHDADDLKVYLWTMRAAAVNIVTAFDEKSGRTKTEKTFNIDKRFDGRIEQELKYFNQLQVDGYFSDDPRILRSIRRVLH